MAISMGRSFYNVREQVETLKEFNKEAGTNVFSINSCFILFTLMDEVVGKMRLASRNKDSQFFQHSILTLDVLFSRIVEVLIESPNSSESREFFTSVALIVSEMGRRHLPRFKGRSDIEEQYTDFVGRVHKMLRRIIPPP